MKIVNIDTARLNRKPAEESEYSLLQPRAESNADQAGGSVRHDKISPRTGSKLSESAVKALDIRLPRYTSYPTADRFVEAFGPDEFAQHLALREFNHGVPLSVYLHIPFCSTLCFYCACNKTITQNYQKARPYVTRLIEEMNLVDTHLGGERKLSQMHWGGGTPTYLHVEEIRQLVGALRDGFSFSPSGEYSIEIDPRTVDSEKLQVLSELGFNRLSLGVQDFDEAVQVAINRVQPREMVDRVLQEARLLGFESTNFDLIYGLPKQTEVSYLRTIESVISMRPERIALYNYAHLPSRFKAQRLINTADMPSAEVKLAIFEMANEQLEAAGYEYIGMDHFALPEDELSLAHRAGRLHRNFQGYSTQPDCDLIALGASAISRVGSCYSQNLRSVNDYSDRVGQGILPTLRGLKLSRDDVLRRAMIMAIMCQGEIDKDSVEIAFLIEFDNYFESELTLLEPMAELGFVDLSANRIVVTDTGRRKALRLIAGTFDRYLASQSSQGRFSRVL